MIYLYKKENKIILSESSRNLEDSYDNPDNNLYNTELITSLDWDYNSVKDIIKNSLRRWKNLMIDDELTYKNNSSVINWFNKFKNGSPKSNDELKYVWKNDIDKSISEFFKFKRYLESLNIIQFSLNKENSDLKNKIIYDKDILNYLDDLYGEEIVNLVDDYSKLTEKKKQFISEFYSKTTKEAKLNYIKNSDLNIDISEISDFLPDWCIFSLIISDILVFENNDVNYLNPEFKNQNKIDNKDRLRRYRPDWIRKEIYKTFQIYSIWKGADIKKKLDEIYKLYESPEKANINDINQYFEMSKTRQGYRFGFRKNNYVL